MLTFQVLANDGVDAPHPTHSTISTRRMFRSLIGDPDDAYAGFRAKEKAATSTDRVGLPPVGDPRVACCNQDRATIGIRFKLCEFDELATRKEKKLARAAAAELMAWKESRIENVEKGQRGLSACSGSRVRALFFRGVAPPRASARGHHPSVEG